MSEHLTHKLATLHQSVLRGKLPRNLHWTDALELIGHLGQVQPQGGDEFAFVVGTQRELFKRPHSSEVGIDDVSRLRRFLKRVGTASPPVELGRSSRMVVAIDHHAAHIYSELDGSRPQDGVTIKPYDPYHFHHHLVHRKESHYHGGRIPEETSFYEEVARSLAAASEVVLVGHGAGKSSALDALVEHLENHHTELSRRVIGTETADLSALTPPEVEAIAKRLMRQANLDRKVRNSEAI